MPNVKIPKRVAGVKIPKKVRRKVKKAAKMAESPVVREVAAAALGAAAQVKAARAEARAAGAEARAAGARARADGAEARRASAAVRIEAPRISIDGERVFETVRAAAIDGLRRFLEGLDEGLRELERQTGKPERSGANGRQADAPAD